MADEKTEQTVNEKLDRTSLDAAVLENNLARIAYTLDRDYLSHLDEYGVLKFAEYCRQCGLEYKPGGTRNFMALKITNFIINKDEKVIDCMKNVIGAFSNSSDSIAFVVRRKMESVDIYFIFKKDGEIKRDYVWDKLRLLQNSFTGNFPGSKSFPIIRDDLLPKEFSFLEEATSVSLLSSVPSDKSEDYISQGIEKLLNGVVPETEDKEYAVMILAQSLSQEEIRSVINGFEEMATAITPYSAHQFQTGKNDSESNGEMKSTTDTTGVSHAISKTHSINVGINVGRGSTTSNGINDSVTNSESESEGSSTTDTEGSSESDTEGSSVTDTEGSSVTDTEGSSDTAGGSASVSGTVGTTIGASESLSVGVPGIAGGSATLSESVSSSVSVGGSVDYHHGWNRAKAIGSTVSKAIGKNIAKTIGKTVSRAVGSSLTKTVGRAVTSGAFSSVAKMLSLGLSGGYGYSWGKIDTDSTSKSLTDGTNHNITLGTSENTTYTYKSYQVSDLVQNLEANIKRLTESKSTGLWKSAMYVFSKDSDTSSSVANYMRGLTQGDESFIESAAVQSWKEDKDKSDSPFPEIKNYLSHFIHPVFLNARDVAMQTIDKKEIAEAARQSLSDQGIDDEALLYDMETAVRDAPAVDLIPVTPTTNISTTELAKIFSLPTHSLPGLPVLECAEFGRNVMSYDSASDDSAEYEDEITLGKIFHMHHEESLPVTLRKKSLASHTFITGSTGSGKSNTVYSMLSALKSRGVTFLVVEPAKGEYKNVFGSKSGVSVYGTNPKLMPLLRINPFSFPDGIHILEHLDRLVEIFNVCWPMYAAMPAVLKEAVEKSYADCGWNLTESTNEYGDGLYPTFADVTRNIRTIIDSSEYDAENKGAYKGSLITRLKSLTNGINGQIFSTDEIGERNLFDENVIVDLSRVGSSETKSLIMGLLVLKLQEYRMTSGAMNSDLRHVTVLEEAHNLLKRTSTEQSQDSGNLLGKSVEMLTNAIAEMRTYGEGFIIADQAPALLDMAVIRNTNTKIIMRLPDKDDRELVGKAANLNDAQIIELAKLPRGVAAVYQNEWVESVLCKVNHYKYEEELYKYNEQPGTHSYYNKENAISVANLLCNGLAVTGDTELKDLKEKLKILPLSNSSKVKILRAIKTPLESPRYTKIAPLVGELFPTVRKSFIESFTRTSDTIQWTIDVDNAIKTEISQHLEEELSRSIRQCIITDYLYNELGKTELLEKWANKGGIK